MIEISDFGDKSFYDFILSKKNKLNDYKSLIKLIFKIQKIKLKKNYKIEKFKVKFPKFSNLLICLLVSSSNFLNILK